MNQSFEALTTILDKATEKTLYTDILDWLLKFSSIVITHNIERYIYLISQNEFARISDFKIGNTFGCDKTGGQWKVVVPPGELERTGPSFPLNSSKGITAILNKLSKTHLVKARENFKPDFTPDTMLRSGIFGGKYLNFLFREVPIEWLLLALAEGKIAPYEQQPQAKMNFYGVLSGQSLYEWREKGWIRDQDPYGWFQWYVRYYLGRRSDDDQRQMERWYAFRRHIGQIKSNPGQPRLAQKQALLQWAYNAEKY